MTRCPEPRADDGARIACWRTTVRRAHEDDVGACAPGPCMGHANGLRMTVRLGGARRRCFRYRSGNRKGCTSGRRGNIIEALTSIRGSGARAVGGFELAAVSRAGGTARGDRPFVARQAARRLGGREPLSGAPRDAVSAPMPLSQRAPRNVHCAAICVSRVFATQRIQRARRLPFSDFDAERNPRRRFERRART
jgi:hypothetical protein